MFIKFYIYISLLPGRMYIITSNKRLTFKKFEGVASSKEES